MVNSEPFIIISVISALLDYTLQRLHADRKGVENPVRKVMVFKGPAAD